MKKQHHKKEESVVITPVFWSPLTSDLKDRINNLSPNVTGSMGTFDADKGLYFNGSSGLVFPNFSFPGSSAQSLVLLLDYMRTSSSGHDTMVDIRPSNNAYNLGWLYNGNNRKICAMWPTSNSLFSGDGSGMSLNVQYKNSGIYYNASNRTLSKIIIGQIVLTQSVSTYPVVSGLNFRIGMTHYGGDKFYGWLRNVRLYIGEFNQNMLL
jgi:hypothetical protein